MSTRARFLSSTIVVLLATPARAEVILQYFETPWAEIEARMPEIAAAGYDALWLPPPTKGTEGERDVGFAVYDRFDLGDVDQRGTTATRYGTKAELLSMTAAARRFGVRVYFDVVMNHNGNPSTVENVGVTLQPVDLDEWPGMSVFDFHVLPAYDPPDGNCPGGGTGCTFCAFQPQHSPDQGSTTYAEFGVLHVEGAGVALNAGGWDLCVSPTSGESRVAAVTIDEALADEGGADLAADAILQSYRDDGFTHLISVPRWNFAGGKKFEEQNWTLLGLFDIATEQYTDVGALDGYNAVNGLPLPRWVRHPGRDDLYPDSAPVAEDARELMMRWIRWLMLETGASGFRLDAIKHVYPNFYGSDFAGDDIAFVKVIQDTYDEMHGFTDVDDADLIDDAAAFGEAFTGSCDELRPYIQAGMRALDFPLFFQLGGLTSGDFGRFSPAVRAGCEDMGAYGGLNRRSGVGFAQSHDECGAPGGAFTSSASDDRFSRCEVDGVYRPGAEDLANAFILTRDADGAVFYDGNNWTSLSFVRSGRADALADAWGGVARTTTTVLVDAVRRVARGGQQNVWVGQDAWAYERVVDGRGPAGLVVLNEGEGGLASFGAGGSFIYTRFPPGTPLRDLVGNATYGDALDVLDPAALPANEQAAVTQARDNWRAANGGSDPPAGAGVVYVGVPARSYVIFAPPAYDAPTGTGDTAFTLAGAPLASLDPGVHGLVVRTARDVAGAADAIDELVVALCVPLAGDAAVCGPSTTATVPADDPVASGALRVLVDGAPATRRSVQTAPQRELPDGTVVAPSVVHMVVVDGDALDVEFVAAATLPPDRVGARLDDSADALPGEVYAQSSERWLDGFAKLYPPGEEPPADGGVVVLDGGVGPTDGGTTPEDDGGVVVGDDAGFPPTGDADGDGVRNDDDVCPTTRDADQADFDADGVGDACDACPVDVPGIAVDADGCIALTAAQRDLIARIAKAIATGAAPGADTDVDGDGTVDVVDLDRAIGALHAPSQEGGAP